MRVKCCSFDVMAEDIKKTNSKILMFGAGVVGQITAPEILKKYNIFTNIDCYLDNDKNKQNTCIEINHVKYTIKPPDYIRHCDENTVVFINISRYVEIIDQLEKMAETQNMSVYIIPMMCIHNFCAGLSEGEPELESDPLIPRVINYVWLGGNPLPARLKRCIDSWRRYCPDYEIVEWNESNYDISKHPYMKQAYECGAYGFVPDYARIDILYHNGGFYLDTDVELKQSLDELRYQQAFVGVEKWQVVNFGGCSGAVKGHPMLKKFLDNRSSVLFLDDSGVKNTNTCGYYDTKVLLDSGYQMDGRTQCIGGLNVYASDYFHPFDYMSGLTQITEHTRSIHHFNGGWLDESMRRQNEAAKENYLEIYRKCLLTAAAIRK